MDCHYVYRITNIKENKHYYGCRTSKIKPVNDLGINYFSSSKNKEFIKEQIERPWQFKYKIVKIYDTRERAIDLEIKLHDYFDVGKNPNFYNRAKQTSTGWDTTGKKHTDETKIKMSKNTIGRYMSQETKKKISNSNKGKKHTDETKIKIGINTSEMVKKGKHPWTKNNRNELSGNEFTSKTATKLMNERIIKGEHPIHLAMKNNETDNYYFFSKKHKEDVSKRNSVLFKGTVTVTDKSGFSKRILKEEFYKQRIGDMKNWEYVSISSNEGKRRKNNGGIV